MTVVSTGQITIVDQTDARTISTSLFCITGTVQQIFSQDNGVTQFLPDWFVAPGLSLRAQVWSSGAGGVSTDITGKLDNRKFVMVVGGDAITSETLADGVTLTNSSNTLLATGIKPYTVNHSTTVSTLNIRGNLKDGSGSLVFYFEADYTDPATRQTTHIVTSPVTINALKTGTNATYVLTRGNTTIKQSNNATKSCTAITADLIRSSTAGLSKDTDNLVYKWYEADTGNQIIDTMPGVSTRYGLKTNSTDGTVAGAYADLNKNWPAADASGWSTHNTLVISENAVTNSKVFRVVVRDTVEGKQYTGHFTITDASDPYNVTILSSGGDRLSNGVGSTTLTPVVTQGAQVIDTTGWTFEWTFWDTSDSLGTPKRAAFVDSTKTGVSGGRTISGNSAAASASAASWTITYSGTAISTANLKADDIIKCVHPKTGVAYYYQVGSVSGTQITVRTPNYAWLTFANFNAQTQADALKDGKLFVCTPSITGATIDLDGDDIDVKGTVYVYANRP